MTWVVLDQELPSFPQSNTVELSYTFPDGIQSVSVEARQELTSSWLCLLSPSFPPLDVKPLTLTAGVPFRWPVLYFWFAAWLTASKWYHAVISEAEHFSLSLTNSFIFFSFFLSPGATPSPRAAVHRWTDLRLPARQQGGSAAAEATGESLLQAAAVHCGHRRGRRGHGGSGFCYDTGWKHTVSHTCHFTVHPVLQNDLYLSKYRRNPRNSQHVKWYRKNNRKHCLI